ncbi:hypothetical protein Tco_0791350 [Tanacetum coccineum]
MDLGKALEGFWDASAEQHFDSKIFSPLHSQMHSELGSTYLNNYGMVNSGNEHNGMQNQYGTNGMEFLETFMVESDQFSFDDSGYNKDGSVAQISIPDVHVKDHEYTSESDCEVIQVQPASRDIAFGQSYILPSVELEENPVSHIPPQRRFFQQRHPAASDAASTTASDATSMTGGGFDQELSSKVKPKADFLIGKADWLFCDLNMSENMDCLMQQVPDDYGLEVSVALLQATGHAVAVKRIEKFKEDDLGRILAELKARG